MKQKPLLNRNIPDLIIKKIIRPFTAVLAVLLISNAVHAQITLLQDYQNRTSAAIGTYQGINFREAGFSALYPIPSTGGKEYWTVSDRGPNIDCANANLAACRPTYDKMFPFPGFAPKIYRIRVNADSIQILQTITMKRPTGTNATGLMNPTGFGSTALEVISTDTVMDCANFNAKTTAKDIWGIDSEGIVVDKEGNFWICEEGGPTVWKLSPGGVVLKRYTPYANLTGVQTQDVAIDTVFKYRKNNRGFEGVAITPNGKIYAFIQSPILFPDAATGNATRIHRILEIDPATNAMRMLVYVNDGVIGSGANQIRTQDWKIGDAAAVNDSTFLVLEAALRGTSDYKRMYLINISQATPVTSGLYGSVRLEGLMDMAGLTANGIKPVTKTLFMDLLANGWPAVLDKAEGLAIVNDSTLAISNDNDFGVVSVPQNGIATATGNTSHLFMYRLAGSNKISNYNAAQADSGTTGASSSQTPYLLPIATGVKFTSILSARDSVNGYKFAGTPDGVGAYDNGNGTFTALINHEFGNTAGAVRAHGSRGAFVTKLVIKKSDLSVVSGSDLIQSVRLWNPATSSFYTGTTAFGRFCSADLPPVSSFYNSATGLGTQERIFMNGEETGNEGRAFGHIATGPNAGVTYELPYLGKFSWENSVASPAMSNKTVVAGMDDAGGGQVYFYIGDKTNTGTEIDKAGLNGGLLYGVAVAGYYTETNASIPGAGTRFILLNHGRIQNATGAQLNTFSMNNGVTGFLRPEDGAWDPVNKRDFYFATTNAFGSPSRLWRLRFDDTLNYEAGGTVEVVLDGTEGQQMLDNITVDKHGHVLMVEDVGGNAHNGKIWQYTIATDQLKLIGRHDPSRFGDIGLAATTPFNQDEEASGIIDIQEILGPGWFLVADQTHYSTGIPSDIVEGGQFLAMYNPDTKTSFDSVGVVSSQSPYLVPLATGVQFKSILTANDNVKGYRFAGTPDGVGAFDNGNGTFTALINHEFGNTSGAVRAHGSRGAFVTKLVVKKSDLSVVSGSDLIQSVRLWNPATSSFYSATTAFGRFCSADLPTPAAFYNSATGLGTQERIFMNGEETGNEGRAFGHIATGPNAGVTYELPYLGKFSWENSVASPTMSDKTVVAGLDDAGGGQVYFYVGTKTNTGTEIDKAGLNGGSLYGVAVNGYFTESNSSIPTPGTRFVLIDHGRVHNTTGAQLNTFSMNNGVTGFLRPEDGAWDPVNKRDFYFATTNAFGSPSRLWRLRFDDPANPVLGGTIEAVLNGTEGQQMLDNITVDNYGHVLMVEDVGGNAHIGKIWQYTIATDQLKLVGGHDTSRFLNGGSRFLTQDEEATGIIDVQGILGPGWFLVADQAHYSNGVPSDIVEGGQFLAMYNPDTKKSFDSIGTSSSQSPYLVGVAPGVEFKAIFTANDSVGGYKFVGTPDGVGAFDNGNGTFTALINHELGSTSGAVRAHGSRGAFVSKWVINKNNLSVVSGSDLIQSIRLWNPATSSYYTGTTAFGRFCSADLPPVASFYNSTTGLGTQERIFMNGEETGAEGRAFGHIATGPNAGVTYELPYLGKFSWENSVASPTMSNKTVVAGMDDAGGGQVYFYVGDKTNTGTEIEKAGLSGGSLYGVAVNGYFTESNSSIPVAGTRFVLIDHGRVHNATGAQLNTFSMNNGVTGFLRPEDGAWDPVNKRDFYFATTNAFGSPSRLWRLRFDDPTNPVLGGTIEAVLNGTEGQQMLDNITVDKYGHVLMVEDVGGNAHLGKIWQYTIATDQLKLLGSHDSSRFLNGGSRFLTQDEEVSGIIDVQEILGAGNFLVVDQAHYSNGIPSDIVEGGQFLAMFNPDTKASADSIGSSSSQSPYLVSTAPGVEFKAILTANDSIGGYKLAGTPDGVGAFDNGNGTFTALINHELGNTSGAMRAHGSRGAFVSKWVINKNNLTVVSGGDLIQSVRLWNPATSSFYTGTTAFGRFCSADLPPVASFYNSATGLGTQERIFMNGEETGNEGRAFGHIASGPNSGVTYELPYLGKFSWENSVASPTMSNKTVVAGMDDAGGGQVYFYVGDKTNTGTEIDKAGLNGGSLYGVAVNGYFTESNSSIPTPGTRFVLIDHGRVHNTTGAQLQTFSVNNGVTGFLRPEDGAWDPVNKRDFYFATTNAFGSPSRLWRLRFDNPANPVLGGTIEAVLNGTEGQQMLDNITVDNSGHVLMVEDVGGNAHIGKIWQYTIATDQLKQIGSHDTSRFLNGGSRFLTQDEEASGVIDVQEILGAGWFLVVDQAHYSTGIPSDIVEGGQFLAMYNPDSRTAAPATLPLQLVEFACKFNKDKTDLTWKTTNEINTSYFEIERSSDGIAFKKIAVENAATASRNNTYQSVDAAPQAGNNYYRLKMVDKDGKFTYSYVVLIKVSKNGTVEFVMYPNPVKDELMISPSGKGSTVSLNIYNQQGQKMLSKQIPVATTKVSVAGLPAGIYTVQLTANGVSETHKLIKE